MDPASVGYMLPALAAVFGLLVGSFLNVVIVRVPQKEPAARSVGGRSRCPKCAHQLAWHDNVPLISWLLLRAKCRYCHAPISARYPLVEALTAALWALMAATGDSWGEILIGVVMVSTLVPIVFIDLDHRIIPNRITYPMTIVALVLGIAVDPSRWWELLLATVGAGGFLLITALIYPAGMGIGDVKMAAMMGAFLGSAVIVGLFAGFLLGAIVGIGAIAVRGARARKLAVPFGPFLAAGTLIGWFWGTPLLDAYMNSLSA